MGYEVSEEEATKIMNDLVEKKKPAYKENVLENKDKKEVIDGGRALRDMLISKGKTDEEIKSTMKDVEIKLKDNKVGTLTNEEIDALIAEKPSTNKKEGEKKKENKNAELEGFSFESNRKNNKYNLVQIVRTFFFITLSAGVFITIIVFIFHFILK